MPGQVESCPAADMPRSPKVGVAHNGSDLTLFLLIKTLYWNRNDKLILHRMGAGPRYRFNDGDKLDNTNMVRAVQGE